MAAPAKKNNDPAGCLSCSAVLVVIAALMGFGGLIGSGEPHRATWYVAGLAVMAFITHQLWGKKVKPTPKRSAGGSAGGSGRRSVPAGWTWEDEATTSATEFWDHETDMFDATHFSDVAIGRSHHHDVALVTPQGGRSGGHYLVVRLNGVLPDFDRVSGAPYGDGVGVLDEDFFAELDELSPPGRPHGIRNNCFWVEVDEYSSRPVGSLVDPYAALIDDYDIEVEDDAPSAPAWAAPQAWAPPSSTPLTVSSEVPAPGQPMALEEVDAVDSRGTPISGRPSKDGPRFTEPDEWTVSQWRPSSDWQPPTWTPPSYTPTSWEAPEGPVGGGSSLFGNPSSLEKPDERQP
ncbi:hypothetical protein [Aestuariimicrobium ganziense]|uniref:hypothetical protein n=1 Tax=Aestuariimicrobium ganziense TaxID=2773677 RepID=UPI00194391A2|nr:hypothetical protein [Aestuariimicrobium ganziense]